MKRLIKIALLAAINAHALTLSVNTGKTRSNEDYFVLHLQQNRPFVCSGEAFEGVQYYRCEFEGGLPDAPLAQKLPFANITATQKNGSYELLIVPNLPSRLIDASTDLHSTTELVAPHSPKGSGGLFSHTGTEAIVAPLDKKNPASDSAKPFNPPVPIISDDDPMEKAATLQPTAKSTYTSAPKKSTHFTILMDPGLRRAVHATDGIDFPITFSQVLRPSIGALDLNREPLSHKGSGDVSAYIAIKELFDAGRYNDALAEAARAMDNYPQSVFTSEFWLYYIRTLEKLMSETTIFDEVANYSEQIITAGKAWMRAYGSDRNYPEILSIILRTYLRTDMFADAEYALDMLTTEHPDSRWTQIAILAFADNLLDRTKPDAALRYYEDVLFAAKDITIASRASMQLAKAHLALNRPITAASYAKKIVDGNATFIAQNQDETIALAERFAAKGDFLTAARLYEAVLPGIEDKRLPVYESVLRQTGNAYFKAPNSQKATAYLTRYKEEFEDSEYLSEVQGQLDRLFFDAPESSGVVDEKEYLVGLINTYGNSDIGQKAANRAIALDYENGNFEDVLALNVKLKTDEMELNEDGKNLVLAAATALANRALQEPRCSDAIKLVKGYEIAPDDELKLFACYERLGEYEDALALAKRHIKERDLNNRTVWLSGITKVIYKLGLYEDAIRAADDTIKLVATVPYTDASEAIFYRTMALLKLGRLTDAAQSLQELASIRGTGLLQASASASAASAFYNAQQAAAAVSYAKRALELQKLLNITTFSPEADFILAASLMKLGRYNEALGPAKELNERILSPQNRARSLYQLAEIYINLGDSDSAKPLINECVNATFETPWKALCEQLSLTLGGAGEAATVATTTATGATGEAGDLPSPSTAP